MLTLAQLFSHSGKPIVVHSNGSDLRFGHFVESGLNSFIVDSLELKHTYRIYWTTEDKAASQSLFISGSDSFSTENLIEFYTSQDHFSFDLYAERAHFGTLTVSCVSCNQKINQGRSTASIIPEGGYTAEELMQDVFIGGDCFDVENVTFQGLSVMIGTFSNGASSINMDEGVVICTGNINQITGPNSQTNVSDDLGLTYQDPDITEISVAQLFDVASIEFDFRPKSDTISFEYVFASDEYCDYVNTNFNDKFGFFLSGPGISGPFSNGGENIAYIPGTTDFVSINAVNIQTNSIYYEDNVPLGQFQFGPFPCIEDLAMQGVAVDAIEYDGFTTILRAESEVIPCELYHIKLVIADQADGIFDSAVFLKKNSFNAGAQTDVSITYSRPGEDFIYEGCTDGEIEFFKLNEDYLDEDVEVTFTLSSSSTATPGLDYEPFSTIIIIPAGQMSIIIPITVFGDNIVEGIESIILTLDNSCRCSSEEVVIFINDLLPLELETTNQNFCESTNTTVSVVATGGLEPLTYNWNTGSDQSSINVAVTETDTFYVTITDDCGNERDTFSIVEIINENSGFFESGDIEYCPSDIIDTTVLITYLGNPPFVIQIAQNGQAFDPVLVFENTYPLHITEEGVYSIVSIQAQDCAINPADELVVSRIELMTTAEITDIACESDVLGSIELNVTGDYPTYTFSWSDGFQTMNNITFFLAGQYTVTITDQAGCQIIENYEIQQLTGPQISLDSIRHVSCKAPESGYLAIEASGGSGQYEYTWLHNSNHSTSIDSLQPGIYQIEVYDIDLDCADTASFEILDIRENVEVQLSGDTFYCTTTSANLTVLLQDTLPYSIIWLSSLGDTISSNDTTSINVLQPDTFIVRVENKMTGCFAFDTFQFSSFLFQPTADAGSDAILDCQLSPVSLDGSASEPGNYSILEWSTINGEITDSIHNAILEVSQPGIYVISIIDTLSRCSHTDTVLVSLTQDYPIAAIDPSTKLNCKSSEITVTATNSSMGDHIKYIWSGLGGNIMETSDPQLIIAQDTGILILHVIDTANFCERFDTIHIEGDFVPPDVAVSPNDTLTCSTQELIINGNGSSTGSQYIYNWSTMNGIFTSDPASIQTTISAPGTYILEVTDTINGCLAVDSVVISPDDRLPEIEIASSDSLTCVITSVSIDATGSSSEPEFIYSWNTIDGQIISPADSIVIEVNSPGTYVLEITNIANGCKIQRSVQIIENIESPQIEFSTPELINCINSQIFLIAQSTHPGSHYSYAWTTSTGNIISGQQSSSPLIDASGFYILTLTNENTGCFTIDSILVDDDFSAPIILNDSLFTLTCSIEQIILDILLEDPDSVRYDWILTDGSILADGPPSISIDQPGSFSVTITSRATGCTSFQEFIVDEDIEPPSIDAGDDIEVDCGPLFLMLTSAIELTNQYTLEWTTSDGNIISTASNNSINIGSTGTYTATLINQENGCINSDEIIIQNNGMITALLDIIHPSCHETHGSVTLNTLTTGTPPYSYGIDGMATTDTTWPISLLPGTYSIEIEDAAGCTDIQSITIEPSRILSIVFGYIDTLKYGASILLQPEFNLDISEISFFEWIPTDFLDDPSNLYPLSTPLDDITYQLIIRDSLDCEAIGLISLYIDRDVNYFIPNVFSPNGDGINDRITIYTNENVERILSFQIYNRWGDRTFENYDFLPNEPEFGWDGHFRGELVDPAVFVFQAELLTVFQTRIFIKGDLSLLR